MAAASIGAAGNMNVLNGQRQAPIVCLIRHLAGPMGHQTPYASCLTHSSIGSVNVTQFAEVACNDEMLSMTS